MYKVCKTRKNKDGIEVKLILNRIYFDNAATTALHPEVLDTMLPYLTTQFGNPSSIYWEGREAKKAVEKAREQVAHAINAKPAEIYFTGSGSEADNWAIFGTVLSLKSKEKHNDNTKKHIITSNIEHHGVLSCMEQLEKEGYRITYVPVNEKGLLDPADVENAICKDTILISIMTANNEIGTILPIKEIGVIAKKHNVLFHTDAIQAVGHIPIDVQALQVDMLSISAHKFHGPKGVGALYIRKGVNISRYITGGNQERGKRAGTENVAGIVGMGQGLFLAVKHLDTNREKLLALRSKMIAAVMEHIPFVRINGDLEQRLPGNINFSFEFIEGEGLLLMLDLKGISASSGSACTSGSLDPSHVLLALGLPHEIAHGSLRLSFCETNTEAEVDYFVTQLIEIVEKLRAMSPLYEKKTDERK